MPVNTHSQFLTILGLVMLFATPRPAQAAESYDNCTGFIDSVPATISTQGTWCLRQDISTAITSGVAITIATNNVTIDCNDFKLGGLAAGAGTLAYGINASNRLNATVRHCNIRGFYIGLLLSGAAGGGHTVEDNRFDGNTWIGLWTEGDGSVVRRNRVFDTGGSTSGLQPWGLLAYNSADVLDNTVAGVAATSGGNGTVHGITTSTNLDGRVVGNGVRGLVKDGTGIAYGISNFSSNRLTLVGNHVVGDGSTGVGLLCQGANDSATDNVISGFATGISICSDDGGNVVVP
jgi:hypothetical protein